MTNDRNPATWAIALTVGLATCLFAPRLGAQSAAGAGCQSPLTADPTRRRDGGQPALATGITRFLTTGNSRTQVPRKLPETP